jgi:HEPN domain-containing protein
MAGKIVYSWYPHADQEEPFWGESTLAVKGCGEVEIDVQKQIDYWRNGAGEDWEVGIGLVVQGKTRHGLFFVHLALEKRLKAHVCQATQEVAPRIHSLLRLAELSALVFPAERLDFLSRFDQYNIAGCYPGTLEPLPSQDELARDTQMARAVFEWLMARL